MGVGSMDADNIFSLKNPTECLCEVTKFKISHGALDIQLVEEKVFLVFVGVIYFQGPMSWQGANFSLSPEVKTLKLVRHIYPDLAEGHENLLTRFYKLYRVRTAKFNILILACNGVKSEVPSGY